MSDATDGHWLTRRTGLIPTAAPPHRATPGGVLDPDTRPSAPEPDQRVTFPAQGLAAGRHLIEVHDHYRAELGRLHDIVRQVRAGGLAVGDARQQLNAMALRANAWTLGSFCQAYCLALTQHHSLESGSIFGHLRARDGSLSAVLDRLDEEHDAIHGVLERVDAALVALVHEPGDLSGVEQAVDLLSDTLLSHFAYEERELLAPLARYGFSDGQV